MNKMIYVHMVINIRTSPCFNFVFFQLVYLNLKYDSNKLGYGSKEIIKYEVFCELTSQKIIIILVWYIQL